MKKLLFPLSLLALVSGCSNTPKDAFENDFPELATAYKLASERAADRTKREGSFFGETSAEKASIAESGSGSYRPSAQGAIPAADKLGMISLDCDIDRTALALRKSDSRDLFAIENTDYNPPRAAWLVDSSSKVCRFLIPAQEAQKTLHLPILNSEGNDYLATSACASEKDGECKGSLDLDTKSVFAELPGKSSVGASYVLVKYQRAQSAGVVAPYLSTYGIHPGRNPHFQKYIDDLQRRFEAGGKRSMLEFIQDHRLGDCDMMALAVAQYENRNSSSSRDYTYLAIGNTGVTRRVVDITTSNHAWNMKVGDPTRVTSLASRDLTFSVSAEIEAFFRPVHSGSFLEAARKGSGWWEQGFDYTTAEYKKLRQATPASRKPEKSSLAQYLLRTSPGGDLSARGLFAGKILVRGYDHGGTALDLGSDSGYFYVQSKFIGASSETLSSEYRANWLSFESTPGLAEAKSGDALLCVEDMREEMMKGMPHSGSSYFRLEVPGETYSDAFFFPDRAKSIHVVASGYHKMDAKKKTLSKEAFLDRCRSKGITLKKVDLVLGEAVVD